MLKKSVSMMLMALFLFSFIAVATLSADETQKTTGTVMSINAETGEMVVKDAAGEMKSFIADPKAGVDLKMLKEGDPVAVESDSNGVIKSLAVSK
jgi:ABC-type Fe3+-hydroxamate transport system substrate-binding protein